MVLIFSHIGKVEQIHTHEGPSDTSLFLHKAFSVKSTHPLPSLFHQEDSTEKYQFSNYSGNIYLQLCVLLFQFSVGSQKCSLVWYTSKHGVAHNLCYILDTCILILFLCFWQNTYKILLHCMSQCLLCLEPSLFSWLMDGTCLLCLIRSLNSASLNW